jgi:hypothetical protein
MKTWMKTLAGHYEVMRRKYPKEKLLIVFDIDGTILDMRHMIKYTLKTFDNDNGTEYFQNITMADIDFHEEQIHYFFERLAIPENYREVIMAQYEDLMRSSTAILEAHRPFRGVLDVIRWFQLQPNTYVGLNTGRPEYLRENTLKTLNKLGHEYRVQFTDNLLFMKPNVSDEGIAQTKPKGIGYFQRKGYRVFAFVDNEPENLKAVSEVDPDKEILLLHADTIFKSAHVSVPDHAVQGKSYDLKDLMSKNTIPKHIQFVWSCNYARESFACFIRSNINWLEIDLRDLQRVRFVGDEELSLEECLDFAKTGDKSVKLNVHESALLLGKALEIVNSYDLHKSPLWFKVGDDHVLRRNRLAALKNEYPDAVIEHEVDFLVKPVLDEPDNVKYVLELLQKAGVNRFSLSRKQPQWRRVVNMLVNWGFDVHVNHIANFETFLQAALLSPRSLSINLSPADWKYFNYGGEEDSPEDPLLKRIA